MRATEEAEESGLDWYGLLRSATIQADDFAIVAIDGHLRFERFDQVERFEDVLHRIVIAIRGKLDFEFIEAALPALPKPESDGDEGGTEKQPEVAG